LNADKVISETEAIAPLKGLPMNFTAGSRPSDYRGDGVCAFSLRLAYGVLLFLPLLASTDKPEPRLSPAELQALHYLSLGSDYFLNVSLHNLANAKGMRSCPGNSGCSHTFHFGVGMTGYVGLLGKWVDQECSIPTLKQL
jgi:hypothetical protein